MKSNPKERFSDRVENYLKYRPSYPEAAIRHLQQRGVDETADVADIGSGTGILSALLVESVHKLYAIEPNAAMRAAAEHQLSKFENFISIDASAEATTLPDHSVDIITVAQAFHWFDIEPTLTEFRRILKPGGRLFLIWNKRLKNTPFLQAYEQLLRVYGTDYCAVNHEKLTEQDLKQLFTRDYQFVRFKNSQKFDLEGLYGRVFSSSYTPTPDQPAYKKLASGIATLFETHQQNGIVSFDYETQIFSGGI